MSDLDRENLRQEEREERARLVNDSDPSNAAQLAAKKKKKRNLFIGIGILIVIGVILAIVLPLTLKKGGGGGGGDDGINVIDSQEYNVFSVKEGSYNPTVFSAKFVLENKIKGPSPAKSFMGLVGDDHKNSDYRPVNPKDIPVNTKDTPAPNNNPTEEVSVSIDMVDNYNLRIFMKDN